MEIKVNNKSIFIDDAIGNIEELIDFLYPGAKGNMAVAIDNRLVRKSEWTDTPVRPHEEITIISAAFGG